MINEEVYKDLLNRVFENEQSLYGKSTNDIFRKISGLEISDDGRILDISGDFKNIIRDLVVEFKKLDGDLSFRITKGVIEAYRSLYPDVDFPVMEQPVSGKT